MELNEREFKSFKVGDIFDIKRGKDISTYKIPNSKEDIIVIGGGAENHGIKGYVEYNEQNKSLIHKNKLTVARTGSVGACFYQDKDFIAHGNCFVLFYKDNVVEKGKYINIFMQTILDNIKNIKSYSTPITLSSYKLESISLPAVFNEESGAYEPDWEWMEDYMIYIEEKCQNQYMEQIDALIDELGADDAFEFIEKIMKDKELSQEQKMQIIQELKIPNRVPLDENIEFHSFKVGDIFEFKQGKTITREQVCEYKTSEYDILVIGGGTSNAGFFGYASKSVLNQNQVDGEDFISLSCRGNPGVAHLQNEYCVLNQNAVRLTTKSPTNYCQKLFLVTMLNAISHKFSYNQTVNLKYLEENISLPAVFNEDTERFEPHWDYMEDYIKALMN